MDHRINADQLLVSKENLMGKYSDIIDGYLRIESVDVLTSIGEIDRLNEFAAFCGCRSIGDRWVKRSYEAGISLIVAGMTYSQDIENRHDMLADPEIALESANKFASHFTGKKKFYSSAPGSPWQGDEPLVSLTTAMKDFGVVVFDDSKIGLIVFYDNSCC